MNLLWIRITTKVGYKAKTESGWECQAETKEFEYWKKNHFYDLVWLIQSWDSESDNTLAKK